MYYSSILPHGHMVVPYICVVVNLHSSTTVPGKMSMYFITIDSLILYTIMTRYYTVIYIHTYIFVCIHTCHVNDLH
jgi:hypothetical protein